MARQQSAVRRSFLLGLLGSGLAISLAATLPPSAAQAQMVRMYEVQFTESPPTIDGMVDAGEWDAAPVEGDFSLLRQDPSFEDFENTRFQALWDADNLYLLLQTETFGFTARPAEDNPAPDFSGNTENWNLYWDPNLDGDPNLPDPPPASGFDDANDGYQIAFGQHVGTSVMQGEDQDGNFLFTEAHVNTGFGNQAMWRPGLGEIVIAQVNEPGMGTAELVIPWTEFNAEAELDDGMGGTIETGLHHPFAPTNDDVWFFQAGRISTDPVNFLPIWNWTPSQAFTSHPHGELIFVGAPDTGGIPGDFNASGLVEQGDLDLVLGNWGSDTVPGTWTNDPPEGIVDQAELDKVLGNWGRNMPGLGTAGAVPEPATVLLLSLTAAAGLALRRRGSE